MNRSAGGSATAGGISFQAKVSAIANTHVLLGTRVHWTDGLTVAPPVATSFETSGPGDDLALELEGGSIVEIQVKKGLRVGKKFWDALESLFDGVHKGDCAFGLLIVCPNSSGTVREKYPFAIRRIADGSYLNPTKEQVRLREFVLERGYNPEYVCTRVRIKAVTALDDAGEAIAAAHKDLERICLRKEQVPNAWTELCQDAESAITYRGHRTPGNLLHRLSAAGIEIEDSTTDSPIAIRQALVQSTLNATESFGLLGIERPLPTDAAWLPLQVSISDTFSSPPISAEEALAGYRALGEKSDSHQKVIDAKTIGSFRKLCVVKGGPGSGKSLLLKILAREFAKESIPSVQVPLRKLATRVKEAGCGIEEGLLSLGLDGTGLSSQQVRATQTDLVILCDGLDECGEYQTEITRGLKVISANRRDWCVVVSTRSIGYTSTELADWRHYEILRLAENDTIEHFETLARSVLDARGEEHPDELRESIGAYVKQDGVQHLLKGSPLLLAFAAALFATSKERAATKFDLYQQIHHLLNKSRGERKVGTDIPSQAVRDSVLNHLGWLIACSPLASAETIKRLCVRNLETRMGMSYAAAIDSVEASIIYWEQKGLIERLQHLSSELLAFAHKTCGEFAAAQHLSALDPFESRKTMAHLSSNPDWDEILDFAIEDSLATILAQLLIEEFDAETADSSYLNRLFRVLSRPEACLTPEQRQTLLERVFGLACSDDRRKANRVGRCLSEHDLSGMPEIVEMCIKILSDQKVWTRLIGWTVLVSQFPSRVSSVELIRALRDFLRRSKAHDFFVAYEDDPPFRGLPDRAIFEKFLIAALKALLRDMDREEQNNLVAEIRESQENATFGFHSELDDMLHDLGRTDLGGFSQYLMRHPNAAAIMGSIVLEDFYESPRILLSDVIPAAFIHVNGAQPTETGLKYLAAFITMARILDLPFYDMDVWRRLEPEFEPVHVLVRAAAYVFQLPAERLSAEANAIRTSIESLRERQSSESGLSLLPVVDGAEIDWSRARQIDIDLNILEDLILHPSQWVQHLAARFLHEKLEVDELRGTCKRLLGTATGDAFYWIARLLIGVPQGYDLVLNRLRGSPEEGLHHLFNYTREEKGDLTRSDLVALENGLLNCDSETAEAAAKWCEDTISSDDTWLTDVLRKAAFRWCDYEPSKSMLHSNSKPIEVLLRVLWRIAPPTFDELIELLDHSHDAYRSGALSNLISRSRDSEQDRMKLAHRIVSGHLPAKTCAQLISSDIPYSVDAITVLCDLFSHADASYRKVAADYLLKHPQIDSSDARMFAEELRNDEDGNIRDLAYRFLDQ